MSDMEQTEQASEYGALTEQVSASLSEAQLAGLDAATARLARHYAELIDNAAPSRSYATAIRVLGNFIDGALSSIPEESPIYTQVSGAWDRVSSALAEHSVASDLGPKLLAALQQLGLTPAARSKVSGALPERPAPEQGMEQASPAAVLQLLRGDAGERYGRAG